MISAFGKETEMLESKSATYYCGNAKTLKIADEGGFLTFILGELFTDAWKGYKGATTS